MPDLRPTPLDVARKVTARVRARGLVEVATLAGERVREAWRSDETLVFYVRDLTAAVPPRPPSADPVRPATDADADRYARDIGTDSPATFRRRLSPHTHCWLMLEGDRILHASWTTTWAAWTRELGRYFRPPEGDIYVYESFTRADARGRGAYPLVLAHICADAAGRGRRRAWVGVEDDNRASTRAVTKAGFVAAFAVDYGRRLGRLRVGAPRGEGAGDCTGCLAPEPGQRLGRRG